jgi:hypothetical protein
MNREGYIRIHRSLLDWEWYGDEAVTVLFLHLLLSVNWKVGKFRGQDVAPGTVVTSLDKLADTFGWSRGKLRRTLLKLKQTGEATTQTTNHWTTVTLVNWAKYQNGDQQSGQPSDQPPTNQRPTTGQQPATIEEGKKERREEGKKKSVADKPPARDAEWFKDQCRKVVDELPDILEKSERGPFFDYWTEPSNSGRLRFQAQAFFDFKRRMRTWQKNANNTPRGKAEAPISPTAKPWLI